MFPVPGSDLTTHPFPWQPEETLVYSALIMVTKTLSHVFWYFYFFFKLQLPSFSPDLQHVALDKGWLTTRANEQLPNWCWGTGATFASLCPSSSCQPFSYSCLEITSELWSDCVGFSKSRLWHDKFQLQTMTGSLQINREEGRQVKTSNAGLLSTPYLPSNFQVQWKVSWTSQEFSEVGKKTEGKKKSRIA